MSASTVRSRSRPASGEPAPGAQPAEERTLTERAYVALEELICTLQLPPGAFLSEMALAQRLGFGRTPIREALQRLARDGLVIVAPRRGILVSEINLKAQLRLLETRRVLEALLARLAAERADPAERERFAELARDMRAAADASDDLTFMRLDRDFNQLVAAAARNEFASRAMANMTALSRRFWYQHYREVGDLAQSARLHAEVAEAIAARDGAAAAAASDRLMDYIESFARKTLDV
ncbi:GntR family transcriptional regulator [Hansschlegelia beijingensis]|uniref:DNA-binding GntR family transcriptional regulator n=1 Tax=Hansschlegelia beijingensis TaxID=1133344 RepID=A0A7W6D456_9HYPH|nr:GntR family transcriptional regulator [Hansschlegelia beijingensis]MBB3973950.1 DNA-binding GntR family transcriptional regulator [Hansschlegelia beijingensis]